MCVCVCVYIYGTYNVVGGWLHLGNGGVRHPGRVNLLHLVVLGCVADTRSK